MNSVGIKRGVRQREGWWERKQESGREVRKGLGEIGRLRMEGRVDINALLVLMNNKVFLKFLIISECKK